ncbi:MAG: EF-hand domain-containing protein, partial [Sporichthyaceae bacterium]|nr:EF-hand domain-containing protein [Sporichthyaceae bacterium]
NPASLKSLAFHLANLVGEYELAFQHLIDSDRLDEVLTPMYRATFRLADQDDSGAIELEEFRKLWTSTADSDLATAFAEVDADGDGRISVDEYALARRRLLAGAG